MKKNKKSPFELYEKLKNTYVNFIETQDFINSKGATLERHDLLNNHKSGLFQEPYLEPIIKYNFSGTLEDDLKDDDDLRKFLQYDDSLFPKKNDYKFYTHQRDALFESRKNQHIVVTTGTGSGKTEAFLLPVVDNLLKEAKLEWIKPIEVKTENWKMLTERLTNKVKGQIRNGEFLQRYGEKHKRDAAIRAMILYPLNALVDDQLIRLRKLFNSDDAKNFMDSKINGHRIYFGRYTGDTPISGRSPYIPNSNEPLTDAEKDRIRRMKEELVNIAESANAEFRDEKYEKDEKRGKYFVQSLNGSEMYSRWDMQEYPPDILITNYSMLNIMLMRKIENGIFEKTKKWLEKDENHKFQLVIDELHSYRGTQGTEIAYLIREFLDRIGLKPDSPQLQILASTASLGANDDESKEFLKDFFGVADGNKFTILKGEYELPNEDQKFNLKNYDNYKSMSDEQKEKALNDDKIIEFLRQAFFDKATNRYIAKPVSTIAEEQKNVLNKFTKEQNKAERENIVKSLIEAITTSDLGKTQFPIRVHYLFKNFRGLWACTDPNCTELKEEYKDESRTFGKLYTEPKTICKCGARVLELLHCQVCGETYFGGYTSEQETNDKEFYPFPESANLEQLPEFCDSEKSTKNYIVFNTNSENTDFEREDTICFNKSGKKYTYKWDYAKYDTKTGKLDKINENNKNCYYYVADDKNNNTAMPFTCIHCLTSYRNESNYCGKYPIVKAYTHGAQKINQILIDTLLREQEKQNMIVFTDSRQDTAKLSAGIELDHYRDTLRQVAYKSIAEAKKDLEVFIELCEKKKNEIQLSENEKETRKNLRSKLREIEEYKYLIDYYYDSEFEEDYPEKIPEIEKMIINIKSDSKSISFIVIKNNVIKKLLKLGINPGSYKLNTKEIDISDDGNWSETETVRWTDVYDYKYNQYNGEKTDIESRNKEKFQDSIKMEFEEELLSCLFNKKSGIEALGKGIVTFDRETFLKKYKNKFNNKNIDIIQLIDSIIRIYGEKKIYKSKNAKDGFDTNVTEYLKKLGFGEKDDRDDILNCLVDEKIGILKKTDKGKHYLLPDKIHIIPVRSPKYYRCSKCNRIYLHNANGKCIEKNCKGKVEELKGHEIDDNFYEILSHEAPRKLTSEELSAQTTKSDQKSRQRRFQDIYLQDNEHNKYEYPIVDSIELLCVTTTMEAGVDIGALESVVMANMPPQRFNYQQRVGRAGRRNQSLATALTVCRNRSHDEYYFQNPDRVTNETPPAPYLDMRSEDIFKRFLNKEILRNALFNNSYNSASGQDVHGEFGAVYEWEENKKVVYKWINNEQNEEKINKIIESLLIQTDFEKDDNKMKKEMKDYIKNNLIDDINNCKKRFENEFEQMGELLANGGLLPMFGFPTRTRELEITSRGYSPLPDRNSSVNRDLDVAISQFAPCGETVKDKQIHMAIGIMSKNLSSGKARKFIICQNCKNLTELKEGQQQITCDICNSPVDEVTAIQPDSFFTPGFFDYKNYKNLPILYDGNFDYAPYSHRPQINQNPEYEQELELKNKIDNYRCLKDVKPVQIISMNDNNNRKEENKKIAFRLTKYKSEEKLLNEDERKNQEQEIDVLENELNENLENIAVLKDICRKLKIKNYEKTVKAETLRKKCEKQIKFLREKIKRSERKDFKNKLEALLQNNVSCKEDIIECMKELELDFDETDNLNTIKEVAQKFIDNENEASDNENVIWISDEAKDRYLEKRGNGQKYLRYGKYKEQQETEDVALISAKMTDVFLMEINKIPDGIDLKYEVGNIYSKSAYYSFAFLLRDAVAKELDIDKKEILVGLRTTKREQDGYEYPTAQVFLSDALENGAGYSKWISKDNNIEKIIDKILSKDYSDFYMNDVHASNCDSSCYCCLQDYANLYYHGLLNWRLAYDMFYMAKFQDFVPNLTKHKYLTKNYWEGIAKTSLKNLKAFIELSKQCQIDDRNVDKEELSITYDNKKYYLVHPLDNRENTKNEIFIKILDVLKRPNEVQNNINKEVQTDKNSSIQNSGSTNTKISSKNRHKKGGPMFKFDFEVDKKETKRKEKEIPAYLYSDESVISKLTDPKLKQLVINYLSQPVYDENKQLVYAFIDLYDFIDDKEEKVLNKLIEKIIEEKDVKFSKPDYKFADLKGAINNVPMDIKTTLSWKNDKTYALKVAFFLAADKENYDKAKKTNWECFCSEDEKFNIDMFLKYITIGN